MVELSTIRLIVKLLGFENTSPLSADEKRRRVVVLCREIRHRFFSSDHWPTSLSPPVSAEYTKRVAGLMPRVRQTLERMLAGDSEKEIGVHLGISKHTVHVYVKMLYRHFDVNSRGELLARFVDSKFTSHTSK